MQLFSDLSSRVDQVSISFQQSFMYYIYINYSLSFCGKSYSEQLANKIYTNKKPECSLNNKVTETKSSATLLFIGSV